ncbi:LLM class flavin-dependent oxidoreductase [Actinophytocola sp.]|uniref:LLM class flavin-dependent oxidoreductase n=1 Tax=Actinophytocola sp. TaxID=1872138 RepID=UPI003D6A1660
MHGWPSWAELSADMRCDNFAGSIGSREALARAGDLETAGYPGVWVSESVNDSLATCLSLVSRSSELRVGTAITLAFARSPMALAYQGWDLADVSGGRFVLGLGASAREQIVQRFGMPFDRPAARMRDYVLAMRAAWACWRSDRAYSYAGEFYELRVDDARYQPKPHEKPIVVHLAAVGPAMTRVAGAIGDGVIVHPLTSMAAFDALIAPALRDGAAQAGRAVTSIEVVMPVLAASTDHPRFAAHELELRRRILWYASRPQYAPLFDAMDADAWAARLRRTRDEGGELGPHDVPDDILHALAVITDDAGLPDALHDRFSARVDRMCLLYNWFAGSELEQRILARFAPADPRNS